MKLFLLQHGDCEPETINKERPLTKNGREDVENLSVLGPFPVSCVYHSNKLRARQSAEIIAGNIVLKQREDLGPNDSVQPLWEEILKSDENLMIVGHLPFLSRLTSQLLGKDPNISFINFKPGTLVILEHIESTWLVAGMYPPKI